MIKVINEQVKWIAVIIDDIYFLDNESIQSNNKEILKEIVI